MEITTLSTRRLNRVLLERQLLTRRHAISAEAAITHLVGMQAQAPHPPYIGLWTRLADFRPTELADLLTERRVVRLGLMRGTVHLVTADDCLALRPVVQSIYDADLYRNVLHGLGDSTVDVRELVAAGRELMEKQALTAKGLGLALGELFPGENPKALAHALRSQAPLVQVPPRALWGRSGQSACTTAEHWLGRPLSTTSTPDAMLLRYLAAFGPATVADMQAWSGLGGLREVVDRLRPSLLVYRDESGRDLYDLPDAPLPPEDTPAAVRFLPEFDNILLSHANRTRIMSEEDRKRLFTVNGIIRATFLVDGFVAGMWRLTRAGKPVSPGSPAATTNPAGPPLTLEIQPFRPLTPATESALTTEAADLMTFTTPNNHDIRVV
ncbi:winged helix DNA-binding domain-containing protein [Embleya sp. NPDC127516]|uniref:winged helix DNA-binding domain-containing protein n=1 Tax=Embleya sp. NPDC127516 TaxID=3363990 RepID=UPI003800A2F6